MQEQLNLPMSPFIAALPVLHRHASDPLITLTSSSYTLCLLALSARTMQPVIVEVFLGSVSSN